MRAAVVAPLPAARLALVDCGHEVPIEAPRELAALIEAFLAGRSQPSTRWHRLDPTGVAPCRLEACRQQR